MYKAKVLLLFNLREMYLCTFLNNFKGNCIL